MSWVQENADYSGIRRQFTNSRRLELLLPRMRIERGLKEASPQSVEKAMQSLQKVETGPLLPSRQSNIRWQEQDLPCLSLGPARALNRSARPDEWQVANAWTQCLRFAKPSLGLTL